MTQKTHGAGASRFTPYQKLVVAVLAFLQFTVVLDFMIISPLGVILMPALKITPAQFGLVVSAYAFSAGAAGILSAGFADRFDRKRLLLFFYGGFLLGTLFCGIAPNYEFLLAARVLTGLFGGVLGSIVMAIAADLFPLGMRGRVMGIVQTAFASSQVLGLPIGLYLANHLGWHSAFMMIVAVGLAVGVVISLKLLPINAHLRIQTDRSPFRHLLGTLSTPRYLQGFATTALLSTGGFMLMPFSTAFNVGNLGLTLDQLPLLYLVTGICSFIAGPVVGRLSDNFGKFKVFAGGSILTSVMVVIYTRLGVTPLPIAILVSALMFVGVSSRMVPSQALMSAVPTPASRGSYMAVSSSVQYVSGGIASVIAGLIVVQAPGGRLERFDVVGDVIVAATAVTIVLMYLIQRMLARELKAASAQSSSIVSAAAKI